MTRFHRVMQNLQPQRRDDVTGEGLPLLSMTILLPKTHNPEVEVTTAPAASDQVE